MPPPEPSESEEAEVRRLPAANEFSPGQVSLRRVLDIVHENAGDRDAINEALVDEYFLDSAPTLVGAERANMQGKRARNVVTGAAQYGLVDGKADQLTSLGEELRTSSDTEIHDKLVAHILRNLNGLEVIDAVDTLQARGEHVGKLSLQQELASRGYDLGPTVIHHLTILNWLRTADVLDAKGYTIKPKRVADLAGVSLDALHGWEELSDEQQAFVRGLAHVAGLEGADPVPVKLVTEHVVTAKGPIFKRQDQMRSQVLRPLEDAGWLTLSGVGKGRGGKSGKVAATRQLLDADLELLPAAPPGGIPNELRKHLKKPLVEIYDELGATSTYDKGVALELLAIRIAKDLTLSPVKMRERATHTGGAEVDLIAEGAHLLHSRWLVQCKNVSTSVGVPALAKEVGMAYLLKAHVVVLVTTSKFSATVRQYVHELITTSGLQVVLVDGKVLASYRASGPNALRAFFAGTARETLLTKRSQIAEQ